MVCLEWVFAGLRQVYFFGEKVTLSDRNPGNLNSSLVGRDTQPIGMRLSLDNFTDHPHTGAC